MEIARRDTKVKATYAITDVVETVANLLEEIQVNIYQRALDFRASHFSKVDTWEEFMKIIESEDLGFISAHWDGTPETEEKIKELTKATIRCITLDAVEEEGTCILTGNPSMRRVIFAKAY